MFKLHSRRGISKSERIERLETITLVFSSNKSALGPSRIDFFASRLTHQLPRYVSWKSDPGSESVNAFSLDWAQSKGYAFPPFALTGGSLSQVIQLQVQSSDCYHSMGNKVMVPPPPGVVCRPTTTPPTQSQLADQMARVTPPTGFNLSCVAYLSQQYQTDEISQPAKILLLSAWRKFTATCYDSALKQWVSWGISKQINPVSAPLTAIIEYRTHLF